MAVLEMGIDDFGQMHRLAKIARPETAVITNIGWCHLENLRREMVFYRQKPRSLIICVRTGTLSSMGTMISCLLLERFTASSRFISDWMKRTNIMPMRSRARLPRHFLPDSYPAGSFSALIPIPGRHMVYNALAGTAVGCTYGLTLEQIKQGIETLQSVSGRFHIIETGNTPLSMTATTQTRFR